MDNREISPARRRVLKAVGGMVIGFYLPTAGAAKRVVPVAISLKPNAFVRIDVDDTVTVTVKHSEMGQGPLTGLTTLVAEELDADWSQMRAVQAPANTKLYNNLEFGPMQGTGASSAMANSYEQMRKAGATARAALVQAAARRWRVPAAEISIQRGVVRHLASARHCSFGALVAEASALPISGTVRLKPASAFTLIGRTDPVPRLDVPGKVNGTTLYTMDIHAPGMLTVVVARAPRFGGRLKSFDGAAARAVEGVVAVKAIRSGVAVYALNTWAALSARALLRTEWDDTAAEMRGSVELFARLHQLAAAPGLLAASSGDAQAALAGADHVHEAQFSFPYLAHAPMEPLDGYIEWDGKRVKARFGSQIQTLDQMQIAKLMDIPIEQVELETLLSGGSFGRRIDMGNDVVAQMVEAAQAIGPNRPLKVVWTREDDIRGGFYRPIVYHRLRGAIRDGHIVAWSDTIAAQSFTFGTAME
uniref:xanthine dehydrogenase family protein molybdopterin-binding subunit n=1 Tax=Janthinobacterium sp. TaxID=1871054 RepID=UPI0028A07287